MHDIRWIRDNAAAFDQALRNRGLSGEDFDRFAPENVSSIVAWLASDEGGYATGADFSVNGGLHMH